LLARVAVLAVLVVAIAWFPNANVAGEATACCTPVPVSGTVCGLLLALSVMVRVPVRLPIAVGVKVTLMVQLAAAAHDVPHAFPSVKSPDVLIEEMVMVELVPFLSVTVFALLVTDSASSPNDKLVGETVTLCAASSELESARKMPASASIQPNE
jgi:hypothetical protein